MVAFGGRVKAVGLALHPPPALSASRCFIRAQRLSLKSSSQQDLLQIPKGPGAQTSGFKATTIERGIGT